MIMDEKQKRRIERCDSIHIRTVGLAVSGGGVSVDGGGGVVGSIGGGSVVGCDGGSISPSYGGGVGKGSSDLGDDGGGDGGLNDGGLTVDDSVESVDGVSGVVDGTAGAIGFSQTVRSLDDISIAALVLVLGVSGESILDVIGVGVLGMRIVVGVDGDLGDGGNDSLSDGGGSGVGEGSGMSIGGCGVSMGSKGGCGVSMGSIGGCGVSMGSIGSWGSVGGYGVSQDCWVADHSGAGHGHEGGEDDELPGEK
ncbi:hypothetical protein J437_LFUL005691 [Ladona fulva]|uniref:Uncharacterized protein n=1 Tax=Ladona fulva TaxID=123851 RepID=A0A8K0K708_LADFU|nr:hypothetical protein J437_LFUL005691 [Ladona fulva]